MENIRPSRNFHRELPSGLHEYDSILLPPTCNPLRMAAIRNITARSDDILVVTFPKSGTSWTQAIVQLVLNDKVSQKTNIGQKLTANWTYLEMSDLEQLDSKTSPRLLKSHLPADLLPQSLFEKQCKVIYVYRNPKDAMVSYYHFCRSISFMIATIPESFEEYTKAFIKDQAPRTPYFGNISSFWNMRAEYANILFLSYDEMHMDPLGNVKKIANFLGRELCPADIAHIAHLSNFQELSKNVELYHADADFQGNTVSLLRAGKTNQWIDYFPAELSREVDAWIEENVTSPELRDFSFERAPGHM